MASKGSKQEDGFEALYQQLEQTVARLEQGNLTLEESLAQYEEGMKLARRCQELLQKAELRVTTLQEQFSEGLAPLREELEAYEAEPEPVFEEEEGA
jgi:exodeoxyribonuclease VII small subunit